MVSFTGPIARGLSLVSIVVGGVTFAFGEGGSKRLLAGIVFGVGHGHRRRELHGVAVSLRPWTTPRLQPVYASVNRPLTIGGADRRLFFVALVVGGATFTLFGSLLAGLLMFLALYVAARVDHAA